MQRDDQNACTTGMWVLCNTANTVRCAVLARSACARFSHKCFGHQKSYASQKPRLQRRHANMPGLDGSNIGPCFWRNCLKHTQPLRFPVVRPGLFVALLCADPQHTMSGHVRLRNRQQRHAAG